MCGINGLISLHEPAEAYRTQMEGMNQNLVHRGPNDGGLFIEGQVALGHRRLSIIDLSEAGHQPMLSHNGRYALVYNGEIYNFQELRDKLDYPFRSSTDTEVLLAAWQTWGPACVAHLNGMYAFAIWDREECELHLVRDRLGIKPLYYYQDEKHFIFSSEVRAILSTGLVPRRLNTTGLVDYLRYQCVHCPHSMVEGISMLPPASILRQKGDITTISNYWSWSPQTEAMDFSLETARKRVLEELLSAVERRLVADVPFGAFLSGGIDSSAIVALMSQITNKVSTFTVIFAEDDFNEAPYAEIIAKKFGTDHHEIHLSLQSFVELLPEALEQMDHPSGDGPNTYVVSKATHDAGITMALSGLGGDELFAGYSIFPQMVRLKKLAWMNMLPRMVRGMAGRLMTALRPSVSTEKIAAILRRQKVTPMAAYPLARQAFLESQIQKLLQGRELSSNRVEEILLGLQETTPITSLPLVSQISMAEYHTYMQNVLLRDTDQMSMAHSLEVRVPFLDHKLVELVLSMPDHLKHFNTPKSLLVDSLGDLLPREITHRRKMGFTLPFEHWMKHELKSFCEHRLQHLAERNEFDGDTIQTYWRDFLQGRATLSWARLWILVVLGHWLEQHGIQ